jgi:glycosyltransferase involved in cell wall biosynthesis
MRVLFLLTQDLESPSGLGRYRPLARELVRLGHQISVAALHPNFCALEQTRLDVDGVKVHYVAPMHVQKQGNEKRYYATSKLLGLSFQATWRLIRATLSTPVDVVHVGKPHPMNSLAGLCGKYLRGQTLFLDCDDYEAGSGRFGAGWQKKGVAFFERKMPGITRLVTTNTHFMQEKLVSWGVPTERIYYLPNGVERSRFQLSSPDKTDLLREQLGLGKQRIILYVGSMSLPSHPVDLLMRAFVKVIAQQKDAVLLMVGGGEDYSTLLALAQELGIAGQVRFIGRVPPSEVPLYYRLAEVSIDPVYDNDAARGRSPLKLFESWASGVPFVTASVGDREKLVGESKAGLLAQPGDPDSLAEAILQVLSSPLLAESLRQRGLEVVQGYYWDELAKGLDEIYHNCLSG